MTEELEYHVASFVAQTKSSHRQGVAQDISLIEGAEVHAISDEGKIVFTIEANNQKVIANKVEHLKYHGQLLSVSPIYHQFLLESDSTQGEHNDH